MSLGAYCPRDLIPSEIRNPSRVFRGVKSLGPNYVLLATTHSDGWKSGTRHPPFTQYRGGSFVESQIWEADPDLSVVSFCVGGRGVIDSPYARGPHPKVGSLKSLGTLTDRVLTQDKSVARSIYGS